MYEKYFALTRRPFGPAADHASGPITSSQQAAQTQLTQALADGGILGLLVGECGVGKSWLVQRLIDRFDGPRTIHWLPFTLLPDAAAFYQTLLFDLDLASTANSEQEARLQYTAAVLQSFREGRPVLLIIDEAQNLSVRLLEEVRLLSNLDAGGKPALQVLLSGRSELQTMLQRAESLPLFQRLSARCILQPLDAFETARFVKKRLEAAGGRPERIIGDEALEALARGTQGAIRLVHQVADRSLQLAADAGQSTVDLEIVLAALQECGLYADASSSVPGSDQVADVKGDGPLGLVHGGESSKAARLNVGNWEGQRRTA